MRSVQRSENARSTSRQIQRPAALPLSFALVRDHHISRVVEAHRRGGQRIGQRPLAAGPTRRPGVCTGFASADYATIDMALVQLGAVCVPLQTSAPVSQLRPIVAETEPRVFASGIDDLGDAVELLLTGYMPARLVVFDYRPEVDEQREAFDAATTQLAEAASPVLVETLAELLVRG